MIASSGCVRHEHTRWKCRYITATYNEIHHRLLYGEDQFKAGRHYYSYEDSGKFGERRVWRVGNQWTSSCVYRVKFGECINERDAVNQSCACRLLLAGWLLGSTLRWRLYVPLKFRWVSTGLHCVKSHKMVLFTVTAARTSDPALKQLKSDMVY
jgi:hypothetical protein